MSYQSISLREANQGFSRVIAEVERGSEFAITRRGREVARLTPANPPASVLPVSAAAGAIALSDTAFAERMQRLETLVDKLLLSLSALEIK